MKDVVLGVDVGTSGVRVAAVDRSGRTEAMAASTMAAADRNGDRITQHPAVWNHALDTAMARLACKIDLGRVIAVAVDGTSGTLVGVDGCGVPASTGSLYNDRADELSVAAVERTAPAHAAVHGVTSPLARARRLQKESGVVKIIHQADWIAGQFSGRFDVSDESNSLKSGYDPVTRCWPNWIAATGVEPDKFPNVVSVGTMTGNVSASASARFGISRRAVVVAGATDGCAAFLATGASSPGQAVTSLGSTLVLKLATERPLFAPEYGVYSHRIGDLWLAGGASNTGGAVLTRFFTADQIRENSRRIDTEIMTGLDYYPLACQGERFPIDDPFAEPRMTPRPDDDAVFLQALFEGIATIEALGYRRLEQLGASPLLSVNTVGGGSANEAWRRIRATALGVPVLTSDSPEAAVGAARVALRAIETQDLS